MSNILGCNVQHFWAVHPIYDGWIFLENKVYVYLIWGAKLTSVRHRIPEAWTLWYLLWLTSGAMSDSLGGNVQHIWAVHPIYDWQIFLENKVYVYLIWGAQLTSLEMAFGNDILDSCIEYLTNFLGIISVNIKGICQNCIPKEWTLTKNLLDYVRDCNLWDQMHIYYDKIGNVWHKWNPLKLVFHVSVAKK